MHIARRFTTAGRDPYESVAFRSATSEIRNPDGSVVFAAEGIEVPAEWSQVACDILAQKYLRKAGVPARVAAVEEEGVPSWLWRRAADEAALAVLPKGERSCGETSAKQCFDRLAGTWTYWAWKGSYFDTEEDARTFFDELRLMLARQMGAPNSPQWFNTGLYWAYGIDGPAQGHYYVDYRTGKLRASESAYEHPQPHACFIQSVADDLVNNGGIMDLWVREARLFKYGSGTGSNFSKLRGENENLSGGGKSSGLMSFLKIGDRAAGAMKSGGVTRRAAKMVIQHAPHGPPSAQIDFEPFPADWDSEAYLTVSAQNSNNSVRVSDEFLRALEENRDWTLTRRLDGKAHKVMKARALWDKIGRAAWASADPGLQYHTTINDWHTCPAAGPIRASNPCSEYMFLDDTACNLASLNLLQFRNATTGEFDVESYEHAARLWTIVLEISVMMAQFPAKEIARLSYDYRTLGLGYANI